MADLTRLTYGSCAHSGNQSQAPSLWRGLAAAYIPPLGNAFSIPSMGRYASVATPANAPVAARTPTKFGSALRFTNQTNQRFLTSNSAANLSFVHTTGVFTIAALFRFTTLSAAHQLILDSLDGTGSAKGFYLYTDSNDLECYVSNGTTAVYNFTASSFTFVVGNWYTVVLVANGSTLRAYINGQLNGASAAVGTLGSGNATNPVNMGGRAITDNNRFQGDLVGAWIWDRALPAPDIFDFSADPLKMFLPRAIGKRRSKILSTPISLSLNAINSPIFTRQPSISRAADFSLSAIAAAFATANPTVDVGTSLIPNSVSAAFTTANPTLAVGTSLSLSALAAAFTTVNPTLAVGTSLDLAAATAAFAAANPTLAVGTSLALSAVTAAFMAANPTIGLDTAVSLAVLTASISVANPTLTVDVAMTLAAITASMNAANATLTVGADVQLNALVSAISAQNPTLTMDRVITLARTSAAFVAANPSLSSIGLGTINARWMVI